MTLPYTNTKQIKITLDQKTRKQLEILRNLENRTKSLQIQYMINKEYNKKKKTTLIRKKIDNLIKRH